MATSHDLQNTLALSPLSLKHHFSLQSIIPRSLVHDDGLIDDGDVFIGQKNGTLAKLAHSNDSMI